MTTDLPSVGDSEASATWGNQHAPGSVVKADQSSNLDQFNKSVSVENLPSLVIVAVVMAVVELVAGGAIGWWLRGSWETASLGKSSDDLERARNALSNLQALASQIASDVHEHSTRVRDIHSELPMHVAEGTVEAALLRTVAKIIEANEQLEQKLTVATVMLREQAHQIEIHAADAVTDALTGAPNRRRFDIELTQRLAEWHRKGTPFCLMMIDVDHFKKFNDVHGHLAGDEVLRGVVRCLQETLREIDIVTRYGGEEFAVIMPSTTLVESESGANRACLAVERRQFDFEGNALKVTVSGGVAQTRSGDDEATLIKRADAALYAAKNAGRNRVFVHDGQSVRQPGASKSESKTPSERAPAVEIAPPRGSAAPELAPADTRTDAVTGLPSRKVLCEEVRRRIAESHRNESELSLLLVKVDDLASMSERHGAAAVEVVLKTVSQFLLNGMREIDFVGRYSQDMFAVLLPGIPLNQAVGVADRLRVAVARRPLRGKDSDFRVTVSTGVAEVERSDDGMAFWTRAEAAIQGSAGSGCDCTHLDTK